MVYVDDMQAPYGRYVLCHMVADTHLELLEILGSLNVRRRWIQQPGTYREHYDLSLAKRAVAVKLGAKEVTQRELVKIIQARRTTAGMLAYYHTWDHADTWTCGAAQEQQQ